MTDECKHELVLLSNPVVATHTSLLVSSGYIVPPIYQCKKCKRVFKTSWNEGCLIEVPIWNTEKWEEEYKKIKREKNKLPFGMILLILLAIGLALIGVLILGEFI